MLERYSGNPILEPTTNWWESGRVFNCATTMLDGKVHLLYRAVGEDNISRFGLALSENGREFERFDLPVFEGDQDVCWERLGVEDPRITAVDGDLFITYVAASVYPMMHTRPAWSCGAPWRTRVSLARTRDLRSYERMGVILPDSDNKDVVIFPEKIAGRWAMLHREFPNIWMAFSDDMLHWIDHRIVMEPQPGLWDCNRIGAGATPFKTDHGWVNIYHGVDDEGRYSLGIAVHDLDDPLKVVGRSSKPILAPEEPYEREGYVPNVCFTCGVLERGGEILVHYWAADTRICLATVSREGLMDHLSRLCRG